MLSFKINEETSQNCNWPFRKLYLLSSPVGQSMRFVETILHFDVPKRENGGCFAAPSCKASAERPIKPFILAIDGSNLNRAMNVEDLYAVRLSRSCQDERPDQPLDTHFAGECSAASPVRLKARTSTSMQPTTMGIKLLYMFLLSWPSHSIGVVCDFTWLKIYICWISTPTNKLGV